MSATNQELIQRFEKDILSGSYPLRLLISRSGAGNELCRRGGAALKDIAAHLAKGRIHPGFSNRAREDALNMAWRSLLLRLGAEHDMDLAPSGEDMKDWIEWAKQAHAPS